jgi:hypothetical protein
MPRGRGRAVGYVRRAMVRRVVAALVVLAVTIAGACSAAGEPGEGTGGGATLSVAGPSEGRTGEAEAAGDDAGLRATLQRATLFETRRALKLLVHNTGTDDVELAAVQLASPAFEPVAPEARAAVLDAGGRPVNIPLRFGAARCAEGDADDVGDGGNAMLVATVDGEERRIAIEQSPPDMLADLHATECAAAGVLAAVDIRLGDRWTAAGPRTLAGEVSMSSRDPDVTAALDGLLGNVIFAVAAGRAVAQGEPWLAVDDGQAAASIPITIEAARCDPHALIEYKRTFILVAVVAVDGAEPVRVDIEADGEARRALEDLLTACIG